jgi:deoxyribose-phosphate aldolase
VELKACGGCRTLHRLTDYVTARCARLGKGTASKLAARQSGGEPPHSHKSVRWRKLAGAVQA